MSDLSVTPNELRDAAVRLRDTADESRRNVARLAGNEDGAPVPGLLCTESYSRLTDRVVEAIQTRGAQLAVATDTLESNATEYARNEAANSRLFPTS